jgi:phosphoserine aminotransferase
MSERIYNFSAGPAVLPEPVLLEVQKHLLALPGAGASILEISHRGRAFESILEQCERDLRQLLAVPDGYRVLFLQGGSRLQFSMVPLNLLTAKAATADYILTGSWGASALKEAQKHGAMRVAWDGRSSKYTTIPADGELDLNPAAAYAHYTSNETIEGVQFASEPRVVGDVPLVCDASSDFLSRPIAVERYGLIYACAQKNAGPAGVTIVVIREDLLERSQDTLPGMLNYRNYAQNNSLYNTAPTFAIYVVGLVCKWLLGEIGGLEEMHRRNREKAAILYDELDASGGFYAGHAARQHRSLMNVTFRLPTEELTEKFAAEAKKRGLDSLKGHRSVGGIRASIYNAMPREGVLALRDFMHQFRQQNG